MFLARLKAELKIPVLGLVDSDPYGLKILSGTYYWICIDACVTEKIDGISTIVEKST